MCVFVIIEIIKGFGFEVELLVDCLLFLLGMLLEMQMLLFLML